METIKTLYTTNAFLSPPDSTQYLEGRNQVQQFFESPTSSVKAASGSRKMHRELNGYERIQYFVLKVKSKGPEEPGPAALYTPASQGCPVSITLIHFPLGSQGIFQECKSACYATSLKSFNASLNNLQDLLNDQCFFGTGLWLILYPRFYHLIPLKVSALVPEWTPYTLRQCPSAWAASQFHSFGQIPLDFDTPLGELLSCSSL